MVQLEGAPAAAMATTARRRGANPALSARAARSQRADNRSAQNRVMRDARARGLLRRELFRVDTAYNGVAVAATAERARQIARITGVRTVVPLPEHERDNAQTVPFIGAPSVWAPSATHPAGLTGHGVRVGVIDSGIDYVHRTFGGRGTVADLQVAVDPASNVERSDTKPPAGFAVKAGDQQLYPSARVVGGFDFAGDDYDGGDPEFAVARPDANPLDCPRIAGNGHGTHVAGTIAGAGVAADGTTYPWPTVWPPSSAPIVGTGVAPGAQLYALRVFGCQGSTALTVRAVEWALDPDGDGDPSDRLDVLNLSLGSPFGSPDDPTAAAVQHAVDAGIAVAISAGNSGDRIYQVGSPAVAAGAVTVANMVVGRWDATGSSYDEADRGTVAVSSSRGPAGGGTLKPDIAAPGTSIRSAAVGSVFPGVGGVAATKSGTSMAAPHVAGALAILRQQRPNWSVEELKAAMVNTADPTIHRWPGGQGPKHAPQRVGTGALDLAAATSTDVVAFADGDPGAVGVSFGPLQVPLGDGFWDDRAISVVNKGTAPADYAIAVDSRTTVPGATWELPDGTRITVPAGERRTFVLRLRVADPSLLRNARDPTLPATYEICPDGEGRVQLGVCPRRWLAEASAVVRLTDRNATRPTLAVAAHASLRPVSAATSGIDELSLATGTTTTTLGFVGGGLSTGTDATDFEARRTMLEHQASSGLRHVPALQPDLRHLDLREIGVGASDGWITFGVQTWDRRPAPGSFGSIEVDLDVDRDGVPDFVVYGTRVFEGDIFVSCVYEVGSGELGGCWAPPTSRLPRAEAEGGTYDSDVVTLRVPRSAVGLTGASTRFDYRVSSWTRNSIDAVDEVGPLTWDANRPAVAFRTAGPVLDGPGPERLDFDADAAADYGTLGALVLHHLGRAGETAETVAVREGGDPSPPPDDDPSPPDDSSPPPPPLIPPPGGGPGPPPDAPSPPDPPGPVLPPAPPAPPFVPPGSEPDPPHRPVPPKQRTVARCRVPSLRGLTIGTARKRLTKAGCRLGAVTRPKARKRTAKRRVVLVVARQSPARNRVRKAGTKVAVRLRERPRR